jgi:hypothetical protein
VWVRLPPRSLTTWGRRPTAGRSLRTREIRVQLPVAPLRNGREPDTGSPGRSAKARGRRWPEGSTPSPSAEEGKREKEKSSDQSTLRLSLFPFSLFPSHAPVVKRIITPRFERGIPGSNPGWGTSDPVAQRRRRLPDAEEIGGSSPPGITDRRSPWCSGFARDSVKVEVVGSTPPGLPVCRRGSTSGRHRPRKSAHAGANPAAGPLVS